MTYLLDTHTLLWSLAEPDRLGNNARKLIEQRSTPLVVSAVSAWEISTKYRLGLLPHSEGIIAGYTRHLDRLGVTRLDINESHAHIAGSLSWEHRDPFDRMLVAQAMIESLTIITQDREISRLEGVATLW